MKSYFNDCMTEEQLKERYRELCIKMHPDRNTENPNATAEFQEMQQQYEERKAELAGDYTASRKGRERRERENQERADRERRERERRKVEEVIEQARLNRQKHFSQLKVGDYIYARLVKDTSYYWNVKLTVEVLLGAAIKNGVADECVVLIEKIVDISGYDFLQKRLNDEMPDGIFGGWEVIQKINPAEGIRKAKRVAKVIMFRTANYCLLGNPQGDHSISDYYVPASYEAMFASELDAIRARLEYEQQQAARLEAERKAKLLAEQQPLIEEWEPLLIEMSAGLDAREQRMVALENFKTVLRGKFPGTTFKVRKNKYVPSFYTLQWEDGPTKAEVSKVIGLFDFDGELTPWAERFGRVSLDETERKMSVLTKAKILQQLKQVSDVFRSCAIDDDVKLSYSDWMMLHLMVGICVTDKDANVLWGVENGDGGHTVNVLSAVNFIFRHTSYKKAARTRKKAA